MLEKLFPDIVYNNIFEIDLDALRSKGIVGMIFDIDNTLVKPSVKHPDSKLLGWFASLGADGFSTCILSNAGSRRVQAFSKALKAQAVHRANKPSRKGFIKAMETMGLTSGEVCMVGDQLFTDVFGAKRLGIYSIYTKPFVLLEVFTVMLKRIPEAIIFLIYNRKQNKRQ